jgi:hypothetical protein
MNIGIIVYSGTGHTLSVAERLRDKLAAADHAVTLERVRAAGSVMPGATNVPLEVAPDVEPYDGIVFGSPVQGGIPAPPMLTYMEGLPSLLGKQVVCLATGVFPADWGRNQTIAKMQEICEAKGAMVIAWGSVGWWSLRRGRQITDVVDDLSLAF